MCTFCTQNNLYLLIQNIFWIFKLKSIYLDQCQVNHMAKSYKLAQFKFFVKCVFVENKVSDFE